MTAKIASKETNGDINTWYMRYVTDVQLDRGRLKVNTLTGFTTFDVLSIVSMDIVKEEKYDLSLI